MDCSVIDNKAEMYRLLAAGSLGNTIPQFFSVASWRASGDDRKYGSWGVRTQKAAGGGGLCRLNCPTAATADEMFAEADVEVIRIKTHLGVTIRFCGKEIEV